MPPENIRQRIIQQKQDADRLHSQLNAAVRMQSRISEKNSRRCDDAPDNPSELNRYLKNGNRTHTLPNLHAWMHYAFYPDRSVTFITEPLPCRSLSAAAHYFRVQYTTSILHDKLHPTKRSQKTSTKPSIAHAIIPDQIGYPASVYFFIQIPFFPSC